MKTYRLAVAYIVFFIITAHLAVGDQYVWYRNSISQLAGQAYQNAWIMRAGFIGFGLLIQVAGFSRMRVDRRNWFREPAILLYGLAILASGIFSTNPFIDGVPYSQQEAQLHGLFATAGGVLLSIGMVLFALTDKPQKKKVAHAVAFILTIAGSFLFFAVPEVPGLIQRLLWVVGFAWLVYLGTGVENSPARG